MFKSFNVFLKSTNRVAKGAAKVAMFGMIISGSLFSSLAYLPIVNVAHANGTTCSIATALTDSVSNNNPNVGDTITYTLSGAPAFTAATQITVNDTLGAGLTFVSSNASVGTYDNVAGVWNLGTLNGASAVTLTITATVNAGTEGQTIANNPGITYVQTNCTQSSAVTGNTLTVQAAPIVIPTADLSVTKTADVASTTEGGTINYTIVAADNGPATSTDVSVNDILPAGLTFVSATASEGFYASSTGIWNVGPVPAGSNATLNIAATVNAGTAGTTITNTAVGSESVSLTDSNTANNSSSVSVSVANPIVVVNPTSTINFVGVEDLGTTSTIENVGDYNDVMFSIASSSVVSVSSENGVLNPLTTNLVDESGTIYWGNPSLDGAHKNVGYCLLGNGDCSIIGTPFSNVQYYAGASGAQPNKDLFSASGPVTVTLLGRISGYPDSVGWYDPSNPSVLNVIFSASSTPGTSVTFTPSSVFGLYESNGQGNTFFSQNAQNIGDGIVQHFALFEATPSSTPTPTSTVQNADLSVTKTADVTSTMEGGTVNYTVAVTDLGPATSTGVVATDTLPAGLTFVSATTSEGSYASSTGTWTIGDMAASTTATLTIAATANAGTAGTTITNTAIVAESASSTDSNLGNNSSSVSVSIPSNGGGCTSNCGGTPNADLSVTKTADVTSTTEGGTVNYTVAVTDNGPATSTDVSVTDTLPAGLTLVSATTSAGSYVSSTGIWNVGSLSASTTATLNIAATVNAGTAGTTITNTAVATESASTTDSNMTNNSSSVSIPVATTTCTSNCGGGTTADLAIAKTVDNANPAAGDTVNFTVTVSDMGPDGATFVDANDALPTGLSFVSATTSQGAYNMGNGDWNIGTLANNATVTLQIAAVVGSNEAGQTITNIATVTSTLGSLVDPNTLNNTASVSLTVQGGGGNCSSCGGGGGGGGGGNSPTAEIGIVKTVDNANPNQGDTINYTLTVSATGPSTSFGVEADDVLPSGVTFVSASPSEGSYVNSTGVWTIGTLNVGQTATLVITASVNAGAGTQVTNTGTVKESPAVVDQLSGNNSSSVTITVAGGGGGGGTVGVGGGGGGSGGQVLGASCGLYLTSYIHPIRKNLNDPIQVEKLQSFLNMNLGLNLPVDGNYSDADITAVDQFQTKYHSEVLAPWVPLGLPTEFTPTSYVYQTTQRWINLIMCPPLNLPLPTLVIDQGGE